MNTAGDECRKKGENDYKFGGKKSGATQLRPLGVHLCVHWCCVDAHTFRKLTFLDYLFPFRYILALFSLINGQFENRVRVEHTLSAQTQQSLLTLSTRYIELMLLESSLYGAIKKKAKWLLSFYSSASVTRPSTGRAERFQRRSLSSCLEILLNCLQKIPNDKQFNYFHRM